MADNVQYQTSTLATPPSTTLVSTEEVTTLNGGAVTAQHVQRVALASRTGDGVAVDLQGSTADGLLVNLGTNNDVTVTGNVATTVADGANVAIGAVADAAVTTNAAGTLSAKLRGLVAILADVWTDAANALGVILRNSSGTEIGTAGAPIRTDPTGTTAQPITDNGGSLTIDGTVTANIAAGTNNIGDVDVLTVPAPLNVVGGGVEAAALRVTLANDSTGLVSVDDNGGSLTVDGTVTANAGSGTFTVGDGGGSITVDAPTATPVNVQIGDGTRQATVRDTGASDALNVAIVDASGNQITTFGGSGGTASTDDGAFTAGSGQGTPIMGFATSDAVDAGDVGVVAMTTARSLHTTLRDSTGDSAMDDANNAVRVNVVAGSGAGVTHTDDAPFTPATDDGVPAFAVFDDTAPDSVDEGDAGALRMSANRNLYSTVRDAAGNERGANVDASNRLTVAVTNTPTLGANSGVDIGDVTINNAAGASAVNIQDGGNSITIDGTVAVSGTVTVDSELPAAAALADNTANPTAPAVGSFEHVWDGATWDRMPGNSTDGALVNLGANNDVTVTGTVTANLAAGTNNIGDVDIVTVPAPLNVTGGGTEAAALRVTLANDSTGLVSVDDNAGSLTVDNGGTFAVQVTSLPNEGQQTMANSISVAIASDQGNVSVSQATASALNAQVVGNVSHDTADSGNPVKTGGRAVGHGATPTAVAAADRTDFIANAHGIQWVIGGHPNLVTEEAAYTGAQTDQAIVTAAGGTRIVVTMCAVFCDNANSVDVGVRIGFGAATTPTTAGVVLTHPGIAAGSGVVLGNGGAVIGIGGDGEDLRITCESPTGGSIRALVKYYPTTV